MFYEIQLFDNVTGDFITEYITTVLPGIYDRVLLSREEEHTKFFVVLAKYVDAKASKDGSVNVILTGTPQTHHNTFFSKKTVDFKHLINPVIEEPRPKPTRSLKVDDEVFQLIKEIKKPK